MNVLGAAAPILMIGNSSTPFSIPAVETKPEDLVKPGKKGVTNAQMIPVLKATLDADDQIKLAILKRTFPQVYVSSLKYIGKDNTTKIEKWRTEGANI